MATHTGEQSRALARNARVRLYSYNEPFLMEVRMRGRSQRIVKQEVNYLWPVIVLAFVAIAVSVYLAEQFQ